MTVIRSSPRVKQDLAHRRVACDGHHSIATHEQIVEHVLSEIARRAEDHNRWR